MKRKAFSLVEIVIVVTIIALLSIVGFTYNNSRISKSHNAKVAADIATINTSLLAYEAAEAETLEPMWNTNYFSKNGTYVHTGSEAYGAYGHFTEDSLAKKYLDIIPLDPRTNQYYSYWVKKSNGQHELAGVIKEEDWYIARVVSTYDWVGGIDSLIREYNWANFVKDNRANLPYNPEDVLLVATDKDWKIYKAGDTITVPAWNKLEIFFSDGSVSILEADTGEDANIELKELDFPKGNNLITNIKLFLNAWSLWTQATKLDKESNFEVYTQDTTASVRWTVFRVRAQGWNTDVAVYLWEVEVIKNWNTQILKSWEATNWEADITEIPEFSKPDNNINEDIDEIPLLTEDEETYTSDDNACYVEGNRLENGETVYVYDSKIFCDDENKIKKTCKDWEMVLAKDEKQVENIDDFIYFTCENAGIEKEKTVDCKEYTNKEWYKIVNNTYNWIYDEEKKDYLPKEEGSEIWNYTSENKEENEKNACLFSCNDGYEWDWKECIKEEKECKKNFIWDKNKNECIPESRTEECTWLPVKNAEWWNKSWKVTQIWNWENYAPTLTWSYNSEKPTIQSCAFKCIDWYEWENSVCTPKTLSLFKYKYNDIEYSFKKDVEDKVLTYWEKAKKFTSEKKDNWKLTADVELKLDDYWKIYPYFIDSSFDFICVGDYVKYENKCYQVLDIIGGRTLTHGNIEVTKPIYKDDFWSVCKDKVCNNKLKNDTELDSSKLIITEDINIHEVKIISNDENNYYILK